MAQHPRVGNKVIGEITSLKGTCGFGHKAGDKFEISCHDTAGLCGFFYHDIFPNLQMLQFGGSTPWGENKDVVELECPDRFNSVKIKLTRVKG
ncbi:MAG: TIGR04076 family protein [Chloroflexi bacterium]|nr:TIGR04076 family protein [Chloroflexota bacterium]